jgi:hypothetical protein
MSKLLVQLATELFSGAFPSVPNDMRPLWTNLSNLLVFDAAVQPSPGHFIFANKLDSAAAIGMIEAELKVPGTSTGDRAKYLFWGTLGRLFRRDGLTQGVTDVSRAVGGPYAVGQSEHQKIAHLAHRWSFSQWGEWILAANGNDELQILQNDAAPPDLFEDIVQPGPLPLPFTQAEIIRRIKVFAVALNTSIGPDFMHWSDEDDPYVWTPTTANSAGSLLIRHLNSQIMAALDLGPGLGIYGRNQLHLAQYVGPPEIIGEEKILDGIGAWGKDAVCRVEANHYGWGPRGIFSTDGSQFRYFDAPSIRDEIEKNLNYDQSSKIVAMPLSQYDTVLFFYPRGNSLWNNAGFGVQISTGTIWPQDYGRQCMVPGAVFDFAITGDSTGNIFMLTEDVAPELGGGGPLTLAGTAELSFGIGQGGIGELGIGGSWEGEI